MLNDLSTTLRHSVHILIAITPTAILGAIMASAAFLNTHVNLGTNTWLDNFLTPCNLLNLKHAEVAVSSIQLHE